MTWLWYVLAFLSPVGIGVFVILVSRAAENVDSENLFKRLVAKVFLGLVVILVLWFLFTADSSGPRCDTFNSYMCDEYN